MPDDSLTCGHCSEPAGGGRVGIGVVPSREGLKAHTDSGRDCGTRSRRGRATRVQPSWPARDVPPL